MRNRMIKKKTGIMLALLLVLSVFGCGNAADDADTFVSDEDAYNPYEGWLDVSGYPVWDAMEGVKASSLVNNTDGSVTFETTGPNGETVRFWGEDVDVSDGSVTFHKYGRIMMLDSIGRIYNANVHIEGSGDFDDWFGVWGGYDVFGDMHAGTLENMIYTKTMCDPAADLQNEDGCDFPLFTFDPNYVGIGTSSPAYRSTDYSFVSELTVDSLKISYEETNESTRFSEVRLDTEFFSAFLIGEPYDNSREVYDPYNYIFSFDLYAFPELSHPDLAPSESDRDEYPESYGANRYDMTWYTIGDVKDPEGNILKKGIDPLVEGSTLTIRIGNTDYDVPISVLPPYTGAQTMHDLVPYAYPDSGDRNVLVVPIAWRDQPENATDEIYDEFMSELGRVTVLGTDGLTEDHSDETPNDRLSLSRYFDIVSYGQCNLDSYITDWYPAPYDYSEMYMSLFDEQFISEMTDWLYANYPDVDWSMFDLDGNGYADTTILLNAGVSPDPDYYYIISFGGGIQYRHTYGNEYAGTPDRPSLINNIVTVNSSQFEYNTLLHEFSHSFGLIDYYDVSYSGINAVGMYDMQSDDYGDWNPYSKYAVGWIDPVVIKDMARGESVDIEIGAFGNTGDAIVIPYPGEDLEPPFCEYMMVDLFTDSGVNPWYTYRYDLSGVCGVRIYHVDARMEARDYVNADFPDMEPCPIGTIHYANDYSENGRYNLELIQSGGVNTFTDLGNLRTILEKDDLFYPGDIFTMDGYAAFFDNGLMDTGSDFGYSIEVVSITGSGENAEAIIRITRE